MMTTQAVGENGGGFPGRPTPPPMGGGDGLPGFGGGNISTMAVGENGGGRPGGGPMPSPKTNLERRVTNMSGSGGDPRQVASSRRSSSSCYGYSYARYA